VFRYLLYSKKREKFLFNLDKNTNVRKGKTASVMRGGRGETRLSLPKGGQFYNPLNIREPYRSPSSNWERGRNRRKGGSSVVL